MSLYRVNISARNPKHEENRTPIIEALVDTGSELTWLPGELLKGIGIAPRRKNVFATADGSRIEREIGYAILEAEGFETNDASCVCPKGGHDAAWRENFGRFCCYG